MPAALDVDRDQVRMLVLAVGVREAARRCDLNENTVLTWAHQEGWVQKAAYAVEKAKIGAQSNTIKPVDALQSVLAERNAQSKLNLSEYLVEASATAAKSKGPESLVIAPLVKTLGDLHARIWPEVATDQSTHLNFFQIANAPDESHEKPVFECTSDDPNDY